MSAVAIYKLLAAPERVSRPKCYFELMRCESDLEHKLAGTLERALPLHDSTGTQTTRICFCNPNFVGLPHAETTKVGTSMRYFRLVDSSFTLVE